MQTREWSLQDAKNKLSAVVDAAQRGEAQVVTRRGVPAAVVISIEWFERLQKSEPFKTPSFIDHLLDMPQDNEIFERADLEAREFDLGGEA